jgi:hypothetical protein
MLAPSYLFRVPPAFQQDNTVDAVFFEEKYCISYSAIDCDLKGCIVE